MKIFTIIFLCSLILILNSHQSKTYASISTDDNWTIQVDDININSEVPTISIKKNRLPNEKATQIPKETTDSKTPFSFNISNSIIDYGILTSTNPVYRTTNLSVSNIKNKFIVTLYQDHPLLIKGTTTTIPDSTCDNGSCSEITTALWENTLTYGLGYRCDDVIGKNCPVDFQIKNYYKQFSDFTKNETPQIIMSNNNMQEVQEAEITYKVNISKTQPAGSYTNNITYIAAPGY